MPEYTPVIEMLTKYKEGIRHGHYLRDDFFMDILTLLQSAIFFFMDMASVIILS